MKEKLILSVILGFLGLHQLAFGAEPKHYAVDGETGGIESIYTKPLVKLLQSGHLGLSPESLKQPNPVKIQAFETPGNELFIALAQYMTVDASLATVEKVLDDFPRYPEIFNDLEEVKVLEKDGNRLILFLEQHIGVPFVSNEKNETIYIMDKPTDLKKIYRYQLKKSVHMKTSDGIIVIEALDATHTAYTEYDFWDADWGLAKTFRSDHAIWTESVEGIYSSDISVKLKSEHPDWKSKKIKETAKAATEKADLGNYLKMKKFFEYLKK